MKAFFRIICRPLKEGRFGFLFVLKEGPTDSFPVFKKSNMITRVDQVHRIERRQRAVGPKNLVEEEWDTVSPKSLKEAVVHGISKVVELGNGESNPRFHGSSRQNLSYQNPLHQNAVNNVVHLVGQVVWIGLVGNIIPADV